MARPRKEAAATPANDAIVTDAVETLTAINHELKPLEENQLLRSSKQINELILDAAHSVQDTIQKYQLAACSAILHLATHSDIRIIRNLLNTFPDGLRKNSMKAFVDKYAPVYFEDNEVFFDKKRIDDWKKHGIALAMANRWDKAAKEPVYKPMNQVEVLKTALATLKRGLAKANPSKGDKVTPAVVFEFEKFVGKIAEEQATINPEPEAAKQVA